MASTSSLVLVVGMVHYLLFLCTYVCANNKGFTTDLIHRDSPLSTLYNPSTTHYERLHNAIQRSMDRIKYFNSKMEEAPLVPGNGEYFMKLSIGTPSVEFFGIADTGSDLTWTQCLPCKQCFKQTLPLFDPRNSSSYKTISCQSDSCSLLPRSSCGQNTTCQYTYGYGDQSYTKGDLATETFTIGATGNNNSSSSLPNIVFGCGHSNGGTFEKSINGLVGLGGGNLSFVSQLGVNGRKFSYCLTSDEKSASKISFGSDAVVSGSEVVKTPFVTREGEETFYYLTLESFTVGTKRIAFPNKKRDIIHDVNDVDEGNILIDSGTTLTLVPQSVVDDLVSTLEEAIKLPKADDPSGQFQLCYKTDGKGGHVPPITANFKGASLVLKPINTFVLAADNIICLSMMPSDTAIFGNLAQMDFLIGYDLDANQISFKPTDCTKY